MKRKERVSDSRLSQGTKTSFVIPMKRPKPTVNPDCPLHDPVSAEERQSICCVLLDEMCCKVADDENPSSCFTIAPLLNSKLDTGGEYIIAAGRINEVQHDGVKSTVMSLLHLCAAQGTSELCDVETNSHSKDDCTLVPQDCISDQSDTSASLDVTNGDEDAFDAELDEFDEIDEISASQCDAFESGLEPVKDIHGRADDTIQGSSLHPNAEEDSSLSAKPDLDIRQEPKLPMVTTETVEGVPMIRNEPEKRSKVKCVEKEARVLVSGISYLSGLIRRILRRPSPLEQ